MRFKKQAIGAVLIASLFLLIVDSRTSVKGAAEGLDLCAQVVIPSLLPFIFISACLTGGNYFPRLPSMEVIGIPKGVESIFVLGLLGGYPVGAQGIYDSYKKGQLSRKTAHRLLGFCNNPGPSFLFGMLSPLFTVTAAPWCLWFIMILSSFLTGLILPKKDTEEFVTTHQSRISFPDTLNKSIRSMALICGWVIIFRVFFSFSEKYILNRLPQLLRVCFIGFMELTNGCVTLSAIPSEPLRFILCAAFLSFGGLCVAMQTASVSKELGLGMYFPGKILQTIISILLASGVSMLIFS